MSAAPEPTRARLRVLVVTNLFPSCIEPDRATYNRQQFGALAQLADVRVLVPVYWYEWRPRRYSDAVFDGVSARYFPYLYPPRVFERLHGPAMTWSLALGARRDARRFAPDVILASWLHPDAYGAARLAADLGVPCVVKAHGSDANVLAQSRARRAQVEQVLARADRIVAVSEALRRRLLDLGALPEKTHVVYNGVDRNRFSPGERLDACGKLGLDPAGRYVLYVGNLKVSKGCEDLLRALAAVAGELDPDVTVLFAGDGPDRVRITELAHALELGDRVRFLGVVTHDALPDFYRAATLVCLPSHNEGVPNVVLEAMACGTPVVATRVGGVPEVVPAEAGMLLEPRDPVQLGRALVSALKREWPRAGIVRHAQRFDWTASANRLHEILSDATRANVERATGEVLARGRAGVASRAPSESR